jgi:hypothetical protein
VDYCLLAEKELLELLLVLPVVRYFGVIDLVDSLVEFLLLIEYVF